MEAVKGESVLWTKSSIGFALLMFSVISSMTFFIWSISSFKCVTVVKWCLLTDFQFQYSLYHHDSMFVLLIHVLHVFAFSD